MNIRTQWATKRQLANAYYGYHKKLGNDLKHPRRKIVCKTRDERLRRDSERRLNYTKRKDAKNLLQKIKRQRGSDNNNSQESSQNETQLGQGSGENVEGDEHLLGEEPVSEVEIEENVDGQDDESSVQQREEDGQEREEEDDGEGGREGEEDEEEEKKKRQFFSEDGTAELNQPRLNESIFVDFKNDGIRAYGLLAAKKIEVAEEFEEN